MYLYLCCIRQISIINIFIMQFTVSNQHLFSGHIYPAYQPKSQQFIKARKRSNPIFDTHINSKQRVYKKGISIIKYNKTE